MKKRSTSIYALCDPGSTNVRYIGKTLQTLQSRFRAHLCASALKQKSHKNHWLRHLIGNGLEPEIILIDVAGPEEDWVCLEKFHISAHRAAGFDLTNSTDGGEGCIGFQPTLETRAKISKSRKGQALTPEAKTKLSAARLGKHPSPETIEKMSKSHMGRTDSRLGKKHTP